MAHDNPYARRKIIEKTLKQTPIIVILRKCRRHILVLHTSSASEMAEAFNCHFANIGHDLARDIPSADTVPERYLISTNATFFSKVVAPMKSVNYLKN